MRRTSVLIGLTATVGLGACAVAPPSGPSVMALPPQGKPFEAFQQDDMMCRDYAMAQSGGQSASAAADNSGVGSAVLGTALGAGAGAALGSVGGAMGAGAAIGGAAGLLAGSAIGANTAQASGYNVQQRYDTSYTQCMYSRGNTVQSAPSGYAMYPAPGAYASGPYGYAPAPYYGPGPYPYGPYYGSSVVIGGGWGGGWRHGYRRW